MKVSQATILTFSVCAVFVLNIRAQDPGDLLSTPIGKGDKDPKKVYLINTSINAWRGDPQVLWPIRVGSCLIPNSNRFTYADWWHTDKVDGIGRCEAGGPVGSSGKPTDDDSGSKHTDERYECTEPRTFNFDTQFREPDMGWWLVQLDLRCRGAGGSTVPNFPHQGSSGP